MKNILSILLALIFTFPLMAQLDSFDISKYALPDLDYKRLNTNFSLYSNGNFDRPSSPFSDKDIDRLTLSASAGLNSYRYFNSEKKQVFRFNSVSLYPRLTFDRSVSAQNESKNRNLSLNVYVNSDATYRMYYAKKRFIEYGSDLWLNTSARNNFTENINGSETETISALNMNFSPGILWGFGRVEDVTHSWRAIRILDDLERFGLLKNMPEESTIIGLANLLAERRWTRSFDYRMKYMEDFELLADFLEASSLLIDRNPRFYSSLHDMFTNGANATRYAGQIFAFGLATHFNPNVSTRESFYNYVQYGAGLEVKYERFKPINHEIQFDVKVSFKSMAILSESPEEGYVGGGVEPYLIGDVDFGLGWYPNTRTSLNSNLGIRGSNHLLFPSIYSNDTNEFNATLTWSNTLHYYISPRAYISADLESSYSYFLRELDNDIFPGNDIRRNFIYSFDIGFGYAIY